MKFTDSKDISVGSYINVFKSDVMIRLLMQIFRVNKMNRVYSEIADKSGIDFINSVIKTLQLKYVFHSDEMKRIPATGPFIIISNHPFGGIDGLLLIKIISEFRNDFKLLTSSSYQKIHPLRHYFLPFNLSEPGKKKSTSFKEIKDIFNHLHEKGVLGIFPAGEISSYFADNYKITDREWNPELLRLIKKTRLPVIPVYFQGSNSWLFHVLGRIHPFLKSFSLPSELFNKKNKLINIRIGNPITVADQDGFPEISRYGRFLRAKTYSLGTTLEVKKFFKRNLKSQRRPDPVADPIPSSEIIREINQVKKDYFLFNSRDYLVICAPSVEMPNIMNEIGRLREITFRDVGEGTNRSTDLDEFDLYYHQLVIWDEKEKKIVGAYRVGMGKDILSQYGLRGFYIHKLFKIHRKFLPVLNESIELGRSFIVKEYQKKPLSLFLLWKGILYFLLKHPEYRYLIGPVSISNEFSTFSKSLIVEFISSNFYDHNFAGYISSRKEFIVEQETDFDKNILFEKSNNDIDKLDKIIQDIEPTYRMPVLLKKYIKLNAKIIGFNIDPKFNNSLDGLIILDLFEVPHNVLESLSKEVNDATILERFHLG
ncbi:MAG: lysophospholipid acyltransferase family protein [Bacteroidia bacterium]|nr:lysophospholipid acyltransferase family protein [Bacteroidia bacterium]